MESEFYHNSSHGEMWLLAMNILFHGKRWYLIVTFWGGKSALLPYFFLGKVSFILCNGGDCFPFLQLLAIHGIHPSWIKVFFFFFGCKTLTTTHKLISWQKHIFVVGGTLPSGIMKSSFDIIHFQNLLDKRHALSKGCAFLRDACARLVAYQPG